MMRSSVLCVALVAASAFLSPLRAQKAPPTSTQRPSPPPAAAPTPGKLPPTAPQPATQPPATQPTAAQPPAAQPPAAQPAAPQPSAPQPASQPPAAQPTTAAPAAPQPSAPVTPQAAHPAPAPAPAATSSAAYTAGLSIAPYAGTTTQEALEYAGRLGRMLDSTIVTLVATFRNTSGQPMLGASSPAALSQRERDRWTRCRNLYWDLTTYAAAVDPLRQALGQDPALQHAAADLDSAFVRSVATVECDNVASMIEAPDRWTPWSDQYEAAARHFYRDFYPQVREIHERDRAFVNALNRLLPSGRRVTPPPALPSNPPFAGAAPS